MSALAPVDTPDYLVRQMTIPASRMFLINKSLKVFRDKYPDRPMYDASQGDGGASLPGVPISILEQAARNQYSFYTRRAGRGVGAKWLGTPFPGRAAFHPQHFALLSSIIRAGSTTRVRIGITRARLNLL